MTNSNKTQLGYFITYNLWQDALKLLKFQIKQKKSNRHFNTLSMFYYENLDVNCLEDDAGKYFDVKISTGLFYGLKKEFAVLSYVIPKLGLGLREYKFFTYPMRVVYYAVGLYLLKLSQEFLNETYKKIPRIESFYGGNLHYKSGKIQLTSTNIYYRSFYKDFESKIKQEIKSGEQDKVVLRLDIENYFNELSMPKLLSLLSRFIKPSVQANLAYDVFTREQIFCFFQFISNEKSGIPQSDNNIISSFIGYLYLVFGDLFIDDILINNRNFIESHKIIRYTDDIYISITFKHNTDQKSQGLLVHSISSQIAEVLYIQLGLKLNLKTRLYRLSKKKEKEELIKNIKNLSPSDEYFSAIQEDDDNDDEKEVESVIETPQEKLEKILKELRKIKKTSVEDYYIRDNLARKEILQEIFDKSVEQILEKPENKKKIKRVFKNFNFDLVKVSPLEILIILLKDESEILRFREFCLNKKIITTGDADLIVKLLCQTNFNDTDLLKKLRQNTHMSGIIDLIQDGNLNCDKPGYYNLACMQMKKISEMPDVLEQTRLRILSERNTSYSVALNHLVNEIHAVCIKQEKADKKTYDVNSVVTFLQSKGIQHEVCIKIRNLFDRRNSNSVSHPGSDESIAWEVTKEEYLDYYNHVGRCLEFLL
ncbi:AbiA family abortive infection protein [Pannus brasiliensis CCIBt3594]|uniref:AbiA family abortive infection protein n=1 Tax=Pannus brasiliensis CCIBt3594 TaxID=1427578 RepID=A0AAW9QEE3_9CHRO